MIIEEKDRRNWIKNISDSSMFQSRLFRRMFFTYALIILSCFIVYTSFIMYEHYQNNKIQIERNSKIQLEQIGGMMDQRILNAQNIVRTLNYSNSMKQLYLSNKMGTALDSYELLEIQNELKNTMTSGDISIYKTIIFIDGKDKAYSSSGIVWLPMEFTSMKESYPSLARAAMNAAFSFDSNRYSFQKEGLLYCDEYTYQSGIGIGTVCILFDVKTIETSFKKVLLDGYGVRILYEGTELLSVGEIGPTALFSKGSAQTEGMTYEIYVSPDVATEGKVPFVIMIIAILLISAAFIFLAFHASKKYYLPIDRLEQLVGLSAPQEAEGGEAVDEMESIIEGIRNLIGEKNGYREKMLTIAPYVRTGMLHSMITGNMEKETIQVISHDDYLDLIKPYYMAAVVNFSYREGVLIDEEVHKQKLKKLFGVLTESFSNEEVRIVYYFRDVFHVFIILNYDNEQPMDEIFYSIHKFLCATTGQEQFTVTMGVDVPREDINEIRDACEGAMKALDGILTDGRGEVYFLEKDYSRPNEYYFPADFKNRLKNCIVKSEPEQAKSLLQDLYLKNWELAGSPEMYRSLIDELHLTVIKTLRELTDLTTTHIAVEKYTGLATLQEVFDYYSAALCSVAESMKGQELQAEEDVRLEEEIFDYINKNYADAGLSLQSLSDYFNVSGKYLSLLCKKKYGVTYLQYIQAKRIEKAVKLLQEGELSLLDIAMQCGYTNQLTFRRNFKSITGVNPSDYK